MPLVELSALSINYWGKWQFSISWGLHFKTDCFSLYFSQTEKKWFNTSIIERNCVASEYIIWWHRHFYSLGFPNLWKKLTRNLWPFASILYLVYMNFENLLFRQNNVPEDISLLHTSEENSEMIFGILKKKNKIK